MFNSSKLIQLLRRSDVAMPILIGDTQRNAEHSWKKPVDKGALLTTGNNPLMELFVA